MTGFCGYCKEPVGSMKGEEFLGQLNDSASCSYHSLGMNAAAG